MRSGCWTVSRQPEAKPTTRRPAPGEPNGSPLSPSFKALICWCGAGCGSVCYLRVAVGDSPGAATTNPLPVAPEHDGRDQGFLEHARRRPQSAGMEMLVRVEKGHVNVRVNLRAARVALVAAVPEESPTATRK